MPSVSPWIVQVYPQFNHYTPLLLLSFRNVPSYVSVYTVVLLHINNKAQSTRLPSYILKKFPNIVLESITYRYGDSSHIACLPRYLNTQCQSEQRRRQGPLQIVKIHNGVSNVHPASLGRIQFFCLLIRAPPTCALGLKVLNFENAPIISCVIVL